MRLEVKSFPVSIAVCLFGAALASPTFAQYEGPNGHYSSESSFVRDINGTPCGMNCTRAAQKRWARYHKHKKKHALAK
jgi:hypothetical protein